MYWDKEQGTQPSMGGDAVSGSLAVSRRPSRSPAASRTSPNPSARGGVPSYARPTSQGASATPSSEGSQFTWSGMLQSRQKPQYVQPQTPASMTQARPTVDASPGRPMEMNAATPQGGMYPGFRQAVGELKRQQAPVAVSPDGIIGNPGGYLGSIQRPDLNAATPAAGSGPAPDYVRNEVLARAANDEYAAMRDREPRNAAIRARMAQFGVPVDGEPAAPPQMEYPQTGIRPQFMAEPATQQDALSRMAQQRMMARRPDPMMQRQAILARLRGGY